MSFCNLDNRVYCIVGATSSLGLDFVHSALNYNNQLYLVGRNVEKLNSIKSKYLDKNIETYPYNFNKDTEISSLIEFLPEKIDGLVFCSGVTSYTPLKFAADDLIDLIFRINTLSFIKLLKHLLKNNKLNDNSSIVVLSSVSSIKAGSPGISLYAASKGALNSFVKVMSLELAKKKIRINSICPGLIPTSMISDEKKLTGENVEAESKRYPLGLGKPRDTSNLIQFLLSDESGWITGNVITIDGGYSNS